MPWEQATVTEAKIDFIRAYQKSVERGEVSMTDLCRRHNISRKTGYATLEVFERHGWQGLNGLSRAPHSGSHWADGEAIHAVLSTRCEFPEWGAKKIVAYLADIEPNRRWPAPSVAHEWLRKADMIVPRTRARRFSHPGRPPARVIDRPNQQWSVDFKGHFRTRDRRYCYPLTVLDSFSRCLLGCDALVGNSFDLVWPVFERHFQIFGLPESILSDGGSPFASTSIRRLSKLAVRFIRLGITPLLIEPGKPQQNGRHERMHRDVKDLTCSDPSENACEQQVQFDSFIYKFNEIRPHEALGQQPPARFYQPSPRPYPERLPEITYADIEVRRVRSSGEIRWQGQWLFVSEALVGEPVGFEPVDDDCWIIKYSSIELGYYSARDKKLHLDRTRPAGKEENK